MGLFDRRTSPPTAAAIEWGVRRALSDDRRLGELETPRIRVTASANGLVVLSGAVSSPDARIWAERVARRVPGVQTLRNELRTDADVTAELRTKLRAEPALQLLANDAVVFQGRAELRGSATEEAQQAAMRLALSIDGVTKVDNYMQLTTASRSDVRAVA